MSVKYVLAWFPMLLIAIFNGAARDLVYGKKLPELRAHQISTVTGAIFFGIYIWGLVQYLEPESARQAINTGLLWLVMTVAFEFIFGRISGNSWSRLLGDYNVFAGRLWAPLLIWIALAPYLFYRFQH